MDAAVHKKITEEMETAVEHLVNTLSRIRAGRASLAMLDHIRVNYHGVASPLKQIATLAVPESRLITIQPWDPGVMKDIERSIMSSDLNITPTNDGKIIRLPIPPLTEERRQELVKVVKKHGEDAKVSVRNIRRQINDELRQKHKLKGQHKETQLSDDEWKKSEAEVQKVTDGYITKIQDLVRKKEEEILEI